MGNPAAALTARAALDRFFAAYYARRPVTATFTGVHDHDAALPDWSAEGLPSAVAEMRGLRRDLDLAGRVPDAAVTAWPDQVDLALADGFLEIQIAEHESPRFYRGNPALWTGEALFSVIALVTRPFAPVDVRLEAATARMVAIPRFLEDASQVLDGPPVEWREKALKEAAAADTFFGTSLPAWLSGCGASPGVAARCVSACAIARQAFGRFCDVLRGLVPGPFRGEGTQILRLLVSRGHWCAIDIGDLQREADADLETARRELDRRLDEGGATDWAAFSSRLAEDHPGPGDYLARFEATWGRFREIARQHDLVTWPDAPIRYVPIPSQTRAVAPSLYYLFYRCPAPFDALPVHDYVVPPIDDLAPDEGMRRLRAAHQAAITLNHVVHHGGLGHHVQNWYAARSRSRVGQVAAVDAASRIAMFCGGSLAEGWACYACDLMEEIGALSPDERVAQQHTRVRLLARAVVDLAMHTGAMTLDEAARFYESHGQMAPAVAKAEAVKNSMFPGAAVMYWLGTRGIHQMRAAEESRLGARFELRGFHDRLLRAGAIPVPLIARVLARGVLDA